MSQNPTLGFRRWNLRRSTACGGLPGTFVVSSTSLLSENVPSPDTRRTPPRDVRLAIATSFSRSSPTAQPLALYNRIRRTPHRLRQSVDHRLLAALLLVLLGLGSLLTPVSGKGWLGGTLFAATASGGSSYYVSAGGNDANDGLSIDKPLRTIQKAIDRAQPGDTVMLAQGTYQQDVVSRRNGVENAPITITGPSTAVVKGGGKARVIEINHDYITLDGFTVDGLWGSPTRMSGYRDKLLYVLGKEVRAGVTGLNVRGMTFRNAGGECVRLRYFAQANEIAASTFQNCGVHDFKFTSGGKNGEGIYIGTAPEQLNDGKNATSDPDQSNGNWVHHNTFDTQGNECVDIKEGASHNIIEYNTCTGQKDPESAGLDSRGNENIFRHNQSYGNLGAGVRLGGDTRTQGINNHVYFNALHDNKGGGIKVMRSPQGSVCGNIMANNTRGDTIGPYRSELTPMALCGNVTPVPVVTPTATAAATVAPSPSQTPAPATPTSATCSRYYAVDGRTPSFIEAERYTTRGGRFTKFDDSLRSGGAHMHVPGSGMRQDPDTYVAFDLMVTNGATFYVWLLGHGPDGASDSFFLQADNSALVQANVEEGAWSWKEAGAGMKLTNGAHRFRLKNREDGASVDKILLTTDSAFEPSAQGGAALALECR